MNVEMAVGDLGKKIQYIEECQIKSSHEKSIGEGTPIIIDECGDGKLALPSPTLSPNKGASSSASVESDSRKYLSIAHIVTNMKARWEVFAMENEIARCKSREQKHRYVKHSTLYPDENSSVTKSSSAPHLLSSSLLQQDHKGFKENSFTTMKKFQSADDLRACKSRENTYKIKQFNSLTDFENDNKEWKTENVAEIGSLLSDITCYTAVESSSEGSSLANKSGKVPREMCNCRTHIFSETGKRYSSDGSISLEDDKLSFGPTYTVTNSSGKSCSLRTSSSLVLEAGNQQLDNETTESLKEEPTSHLKLAELSREYDNILIAKNEPMVWNVHMSSTQINQCYISANKENPENKICSNVNFEPNVIRPVTQQKICKKCGRAIFPGQAKFENSTGRELAWHKNCFRCSESTCQEELHRFDHILFNGEPFCFQHYIQKSKASRCKGCSEFIVDEVYTYALNDYWHQDHFICNNCQTPLVNSEFIKIGNNVVCLKCHKALFGKNCQTCGKLVEIHERFVHSGGLCWHSNDFCLQCETCHNSLIGRTRFYRKFEHLYCNRFCSQLRGPP